MRFPPSAIDTARVRAGLPAARTSASGGIHIAAVDVDDVFEVDQLVGPRQSNHVAPELFDRAEVTAGLERDGFVRDVDFSAGLDDVALL